MTRCSTPTVIGPSGTLARRGGAILGDFLPPIDVRPQVEHRDEFVAHALDRLQFAQERRSQIRELRLIQLAEERGTANVQKLEKLERAPAPEGLRARGAAELEVFSMAAGMAAVNFPPTMVMRMCMSHAITTFRIHSYTFVCDLTHLLRDCQLSSAYAVGFAGTAEDGTTAGTSRVPAVVPRHPAMFLCLSPLPLHGAAPDDLDLSK